MNAQRLLAAFYKIGDDPDRIQQLRKIAVALAISGKLDNGATSMTPSEVLQAVNRVKAALVKRGEVPKPKRMEEVTAEQLPADFTDPTRFAPLSELARVEKGLTGIQQAQPGGYPLVVTSAERLTCDHFDYEGAAAIIPLVSSTGHGNASINRLHYQEGKFALGTILVAVFPYDPALISARFVFEYLSAFKEELLVSRMTGTANVTLSVGRVAQVPVPLICPEVQRKVDELMALCDRLEAARAGREAVRDRLTAATLASLIAPQTDTETFSTYARFALQTLPTLTTRPDQIKTLRQTILNLAVRGKLVKQDPSDEPAAELLKRIAKERTHFNRRAHELPEMANPQELGELPANWAATPLIGIGSWAIGAGFPKNEQGMSDGPFFFLKVSDMNLLGNEKYIITGNNFIDAEAASRMRAKVHPPGTIIFPKIGGAIATNKRRILTRGSAIDNNCLGITFGPEISTEWAYLLMTSIDLTKYQAGTAVPALQQGVLERIPIPLPPLAEQHRIVAKVDGLMALCDQLEASLTIATTTRCRFLEALLHEALGGQSEAA